MSDSTIRAALPWPLAAGLLALAAAVAGPLLAAQSPAATPPVVFTDVTRAAGIAFTHVNGAFGRKYLPETMGAGAAFVDVDNDGDADVFLVNGTRWPGHPGPAGAPALYRNNGDGTFTDIARTAGLTASMYGMGVSAADYDNDGWEDLFVTGLGGNRLYHNDGRGRFSDVTARSGVGGGGFSTSAAFFDYDRDGRLDLFVATYVKWSAATDIFCTLDGKTKSYCSPESYTGDSCRLYRNRGDGTFEDVTRPSGLLDPTAKALGVALVDVDRNGWIDLFVANDLQPNRLYRNNGDGTFTDVGMAAGVAFGEGGVARAGMGVDAADYAREGDAGLLVGNFTNESLGLYRQAGNGLFIDEAPVSGVGLPSFLTLTFGAFFFDYDLDGWLDIFAANGHLDDRVGSVQPRVTWAQPPHLFRNLGNRHFEDVVPAASSDLGTPMVARGAAYADYDQDGDLDVLVTTNGGPAHLFRNDGGNRNRYLRVRLIGSSSNRDGIGSKVTVTLPGGAKLWRLVHTGSSYCSQSELTLTFGAGRAERVDAVDVAWPSGSVDHLGPTATNQQITIRERPAGDGRSR